MKKLVLNNIVWKEEKYYVAQCLNVEVSSFGKTKKQALVNLDEALELYFEDMPVTNTREVGHPEIVKLSLSHA